MDKLRLRFTKTGRAVYISHLDLMRTFQRAFLRSGLHVRHTEGFNPHAYSQEIKGESEFRADLVRARDTYRLPQ